MAPALAERIAVAGGLHFPAIDLHLRIEIRGLVDSVGIRHQYGIGTFGRTHVKGNDL